MSNCLTCKEPTNNPKYCSRSCAAKANNSAKPRRPPEGECKMCGVAISKRWSYCEYHRQKTDWSQVTIGQIKGRAKYQVSAQIRSLARKAYRKSDHPKQCAVCGYDNHYEVCHKKGINTFPLDTPLSVVNSLDNLIALCPNHHWEIDNLFRD